MGAGENECQISQNYILHTPSVSRRNLVMRTLFFMRYYIEPSLLETNGKILSIFV